MLGRGYPRSTFVLDRQRQTEPKASGILAREAAFAYSDAVLLLPNRRQIICTTNPDGVVYHHVDQVA